MAFFAQTMLVTSRKLHRAVGFVACIPLFLIAVTGMVYGICRFNFQIEKESVVWIVRLHTGKLFGLGTIYPIVMGFCLLALLYSGISMSKLCQRRKQLRLSSSPRAAHNICALIACLPLTICAATGLVYRICTRIFAVESSEVKWMIHLHTGSVFGLETVFPFFAGLSLLGMLVSGTPLLPAAASLLQKFSFPPSSTRTQLTRSLSPVDEEDTRKLLAEM
eukprot:GILK01010532.1.p1 GENE.GILK01010532.1~~GILK01010532.1.p1  ORF type:complete len:220 (+),score=11.80 GILK01010532.1:61-720(+)